MRHLKSYKLFKEETEFDVQLTDEPDVKGAKDAVINQTDIINNVLSGKLKKQKELVMQMKYKYMQTLRENKDKYMDIKNGSLHNYSPKYVEMIKVLRKSVGTVLVYSYFKTTIGLNTFAIALEQNDNYRKLELLKVKTGRGANDYKWEINPKCMPNYVLGDDSDDSDDDNSSNDNESSSNYGKKLNKKRVKKLREIDDDLKFDNEISKNYYAR